MTGTRNAIHFLIREYELATSYEIAAALGLSVERVLAVAPSATALLRRDAYEAKKRGSGIDPDMIRILRRRSDGRIKAAALGIDSSYYREQR